MLISNLTPDMMLRFIQHGLSCFLRKALILACSLLCFPGTTYSQAPGDTFVHLSEWNWSDIAEECEQFLGPRSFHAVLVSSPQEHAIITDPPYPWWQRYQPVSYQIGSRSGTRKEFAEMVARCHAVGVDVYTDALINHMASADGGPRTGSAGTPYDGYTYPTTGTSGPDYTEADFHHSGDIENYGRRAQVQRSQLVGLADLNTGSESVQRKITAYLNDLLSLGVDGFRIDAAKHIAASELAAIITQLHQTRDARPPYIFQDVIQSGPEPIKAYEYYDDTRGYANGDVTELEYGRKLAEMFGTEGEIALFREFWEKWNFMPNEYAVVFVDYFDNQRGAGGQRVLTHKDGDLYVLANIFMLAWPYGYPQLTSSYYFEDSNQGPPSDANGHTNSIYTNGTPDFTGWIAEHRWTPIAAMVKFRHGAGTTSVINWWDNGNNQIAFGRGDKGFIAINHERTALVRTFQTGMPPGVYCNIIDGNLASGDCAGSKITVDGNRNALIRVAPEQAVVIHVEAKQDTNY